MHYLGGKFRIAKHIAKYINHLNPTYVWEPFCGACWVTREISPYKTNTSRTLYASDGNHYLISLYEKIRDGIFIPPDTISEKDYNRVKENPGLFPDYYVGFVGIGCSWGGKWFGGYARDKTGRNYTLNAKNSLMKLKPYLTDVKFLTLDFITTKSIGIENCVIYCDPPYQGVTTYGYFSASFQHDVFWENCRELSKHNTVIVSEYDAPEDFVQVAQFGVTTDLRGSDGKQIDRVERLFVPEGQEHLFRNLT